MCAERQLFNIINTVNEVTLPPRQKQRVIVSFSASGSLYTSATTAEEGTGADQRPAASSFEVKGHLIFAVDGDVSRQVRTWLTGCVFGVRTVVGGAGDGVSVFAGWSAAENRCHKCRCFLCESCIACAYTRVSIGRVHVFVCLSVAVAVAHRLLRRCTPSCTAV